MRWLSREATAHAEVHDESGEETTSSSGDDSPDETIRDCKRIAVDRNGRPSRSRETHALNRDVPFEQLEALRQDGNASIRALKARDRGLKGLTGGPSKRDGKHKPVELSSKKPVPRFRESVQGMKREVRDPRFESLAGAFNETKFKKQYAFVFDEVLPDERKTLKASLAKTKAPARKEELQAQLANVEQQLRAEQARRKKDQATKAVKAHERELVKAGKKPFYLKQSEKKRLDLIAKYNELKDSGRLETFMTKRLRKNAAKDHRYLPSARRAAK